jgi:uncharacterized protein (DUF2236 family)
VVGGGTTAERPLGPGSGNPAGDLAGLYGPGSEAWRLNREAALLLGAGPRAVLLQVAHPLVAEGVDQHSSFTADPWKRLDGTLRSYLRIVYGTTSAARSEARRLAALHRRVSGPVSDAGAAARFGPAYAAGDPALALWVHATLVDSTLVAVERWLGPLPPDRRARFYAETRAAGRLLGVPDAMLPPDIGAFEAYLAGMLAPDGPVHPTAVSRRLAAAILRPALAPVAERGPVADRLGAAGPAVAAVLRRVPPAFVSPLLVPAIGLLPAGLRTELGLPWGPAERAIDAWLVTSWRAWRPLLPPSVRWFPQARAAFARMGVDAG